MRSEVGWVSGTLGVNTSQTRVNINRSSVDLLVLMRLLTGWLVDREPVRYPQMNSKYPVEP